MYINTQNNFVDFDNRRKHLKTAVKMVFSNLLNKLKMFHIFASIYLQFRIINHTLSCLSYDGIRIAYLQSLILLREFFELKKNYGRI